MHLLKKSLYLFSKYLSKQQNILLFPILFKIVFHKEENTCIIKKKWIYVYLPSFEQVFTVPFFLKIRGKIRGAKMEKATSLSVTVSVTDDKVKYNNNVRRVLSEKLVLAHILVNVAKEFKGMKPEDMVGMIEGEPQIACVPVNPGETNNPRIKGSETVDTVPYEGMIQFDIRFDVSYPEGAETVRLLIGVEAQNDYYPGYKIVTRGVFYGARMISAQLETEFSDSDYDNIKKLYSIWICMDVPKYAENTITAYEIQKRDIVGNFPEERTRYDLLSIITICLSSEVAGEKENLKLHRLLGTLLSSKMKAEEKKKILEEEYHIPMREELERSVISMCNLADGIEQKGIEQGIERGIEQGIKALIETCKELGLSRNETVLKIVEKFGITKENSEKYVERYW